MNLMFFINSILLGVGLAMDAFSVCLANAFHEPQMKKSRMCAFSSVYAIFQFVMPLIGWICVHTIATIFSSFQKFIPWIALLLLLFIGGKMIFEAFFQKEENSDEPKCITFPILLLQGVATSIDALSVGFTISDYDIFMALLACFIIALVTYIITTIGLLIGKKVGNKLNNKADILGGTILIAIGIEIFVKGVFF